MLKKIFLLLGILFIQSRLLAQPANDNCVNAISLSPSPTLTCSTTPGTNSGVVSVDYDPCAEISKRNVWYKFTATNGTHIVQITLGTMQNGIINGFANGCGILTHLNCGGFGQAGPGIQQVLNGLVIGQEYLIAISTAQQSEEGTFDICILTPPPPPNDECTGAQSLTVNAGNVPAIRTNGNTQFATQSQPACTGTADDDVWYSFTATQANHRVFIFNTGNSYSLEVFSGSCVSLVSIACSTPSGTVKSVSLTGLTAGQTYFIRTYSFQNSFSSQGSFQIAVTSAPQNDECSNAFSVAPSANGSNECTSSITGSTFDATQSSLDCFGSTSTSNDTWFSFIASQPVHTVKVHGFGSNVVRFQVMSGTCAGLTSLFCNLPAFVADTAMATVGNLTTGQTYLVRVYSGNSGGVQGLFNVCITSPVFPANDECLNAINLIPSADSTTNFSNGNTVGATNVTLAGSCNSGGLDVWYKFTASSTQHVIKAVEITGSDLQIELFSGACGSLIHQRCGNDSLFGVGNLTIGETYFVRLYYFTPGAGHNFQIAVFTPQILPNDECNNAIIITPTSDASCDEIAGTNLGATQSVNDNCNGNTLIGNIKDVWYQFIASSSSHRIRLIRGTGEFLRFKLYSGTCSALVAISCSVQNTSSVIGTGIEQRFDGLTIGTNYLVRVFNNGTEVPGTFDLCIKTVVIPSNNECAAPTVLSPQASVTFGTFITGNSTDATTSVQATLCSTGQDDDVWYEFTATQSNMKVFLQNGTIGTTRVVVYSGTCAGLTLVKCQTGNTRDNVVTLSGLSVGTVYLVRVYSSATSGSQGTFSIMVTTEYNVPVNDDCINATELFPATGNTCASIQGSTIDAGASGNASCINGNEVWYRFVATASSHRVNVEGLVNTPVITVFSGTCAALTQLPSACAIGASQVSVTVSSLTAGNTYFIKVLSNTTSSFSQSIFNICITTAQVPANDLCSNAQPLAVDNDANSEPLQVFSTNLATFSGVPNCFAIGNDVWFTFTAPQGPATIEVNSLNTNPGIELMEGNCGALVSLLCNGTSNSTINNILNAPNLITGNTYFIRVSASSFSGPLEFKIKVYRSLSPKINNSIDSVCLMANLVQNPGLETDFFVQPSFIGAANPGTEYIPKWRLPTRGTGDFFNGLNSTGSSVEVPANLCFGSQSARNGYGYGGIFAYSSSSSSYREYLENELSAPLVPGKRYLVSMYISLAEFSTIAIDNIGIAFRTAQTKELTFSNLGFTPQVISPDNTFINDKKGWVNISAIVIADQPYKYLVIGNFKNNALTDTIRLADTSRVLSGGSFSGCASTAHTSYYFVDDVVVSEIDGAVSGCGVLPLQLLTFAGQRINERIQLKWKTQNEHNTSRFDIQRSHEGINFSVLGNVPARNTPGEHHYSFDDIDPYSGVNYYRLKQMDIDGRFTYSNIIQIKMEALPALARLWPNPVSDVLNLEYTGRSSFVDIRVFNSLGVVLKTLRLSTHGYMKVDMRSLPMGIYWIETNDGKYVQRSSFIKH